MDLDGEVGLEAEVAGRAAVAADHGQKPALHLPTTVMGLVFANVMGLAAGVDRTGRLLGPLAGIGFGHVEVGTLTRLQDMAIGCSPTLEGFRVGVNIASPRTGLPTQVIEDYVEMMRAVWARADYVVANLSSPFAGRDGDTPGVDDLILRMKEEQGRLFAKTGRFLPLLVKVHGGALGSPLPAAILSARCHGLDGVVLVSSCARRLAGVCDYLAGAAVISVGSVAGAEDAAERIAAGARLVQIHTAFVRGGALAARRILDSTSAAGGIS